MAFKELPDSSEFADLIDNNCIYVDKTDIIAKFVKKKRTILYITSKTFW